MILGFMVVQARYLSKYMRVSGRRGVGRRGPLRLPDPDEIQRCLTAGMEGWPRKRKPAAHASRTPFGNGKKQMRRRYLCLSPLFLTPHLDIG
ncbi:hypothetical protein CDAR_197371 [Caerostris darwini]|uniref:Uncharacterized protein n=1 Tax=Caerostris darwini TaxID=1538125 RepID=A0AAV4R2C2_9ARAC|nr:hypothetical protein CDAR_197371 [Caerostris darwini]